MSDLSHLVDELQLKVEKLIHLQKKLADENQRLVSVNGELLNKNEQLNIEIKNSEEKNKILKLAKSLSDTNDGGTNIKLKINELVRDIDKCMALLNR